MQVFFNQLAISFDLPALDWIAANLHCPFMDTLMLFFSALFEPISCVLFMALLVFIPKTRKFGITLTVANIFGLLFCNLIVKNLCGRIRPYELQEQLGNTIPLLVKRLSDNSFPSGHSASAFEFAVTVGFHNRKWAIPAFFLAFCVAFSRMYLYMHYPTDVLGGICIGILCGILAGLTKDKIWNMLCRTGQKLRAKLSKAA